VNKAQIEEIAKALAPVIAALVKKELASIEFQEGPEGKQGPPGEPGLPGEDGKDADADAIIEAVTKSIVVPDAVPGADGKDGRDGRDGKDADEAAIIEAVSKAIVIPEPIPGLDGKDGRDGQDGRDAIDLEILPGIDEQKQYPRGSYATHRGGLWRAYERTHGMRGWECIVDGVDEVKAEQVSERGFEFTLHKSSGSVIAKSCTIPAMIYKEIYSDKTQYEKGDAVTYAGSLWVATSDSPTSAPGTGSAEDTGWRLAVKSGRNGKDLRDSASTHDKTKGLKI
jgi:hypothetical protein